MIKVDSLSLMEMLRLSCRGLCIPGVAILILLADLSVGCHELKYRYRHMPPVLQQLQWD